MNASDLWQTVLEVATIAGGIVAAAEIIRWVKTWLEGRSVPSSRLVRCWGRAKNAVRVTAAFLWNVGNLLLYSTLLLIFSACGAFFVWFLPTAFLTDVGAIEFPGFEASAAVVLTLFAAIFITVAVLELRSASLEKAKEINAIFLVTITLTLGVTAFVGWLAGDTSQWLAPVTGGYLGLAGYNLLESIGKEEV